MNLIPNPATRPSGATCPLMVSLYIRLYFTDLNCFAELLRCGTMAQQFTPIASLDDSRTDWTILGRVSRKWLAIRPGSRSDNANLECIVIDQQGGQIHIEIDRDYFATYDPILREGEIYIISHFHVIPTTQFEPVTRAVKIEFMDGTSVVPYNGDPIEIPSHNFEFCDFQDIPNHEGDDEYLIDLVGILDTIRDVETVPTRYGTTKRTNIVLRDLQENLAHATFWAKISDIFNELPLRQESKPVVLVVTSLSVKRIAGLHRASSTAATKIYVNLDHPAVEDYIHKAQTESNGPQRLPAERLARTRFGHAEPESGFTLQEIQNMPRDCLRDRQFRTTIDIVEFELGNNWYYDGCPACSRKINQRYVKTNCEGCSARGIYAVPCYKIEAKVTDGSDTSTYILFTNMAEQFVGMPITSVRLRQPTTRRRIPPLISNLIGTRWDLQVGVNAKSLTMAKLIFNVNKVIRQLPSQTLLALPSNNPAAPSTGSHGTRTTMRLQPQSDSNEFGNHLQGNSSSASDTQQYQSQPGSSGLAQLATQITHQSSVFRDKGKRPMFDGNYERQSKRLSYGSEAQTDIFIRSSAPEKIDSLNFGTHKLCNQQQTNLSELQVTPGNIIKANIAQRKNMHQKTEKADSNLTATDSETMHKDLDESFWNDLKEVDEEIHFLYKGKEKLLEDEFEYHTPTQELPQSFDLSPSN